MLEGGQVGGGGGPPILLDSRVPDNVQHRKGIDNVQPVSTLYIEEAC